MAENWTEGWRKGGAGGLFGLLSGACFALSANAYRICGIEIAPDAPFLSSSITLVLAQALQSLVLGAILYAFDRRALSVLFKSLRPSFIAGLAGAAASACWFAALTLAPAALVRAVNALVEAPVATLVGWLKFKERPDIRRTLGASLIVIGVIATVLGELGF
jgi:drug/metabolite transporter (DMT)-like permease